MVCIGACFGKEIHGKRVENLAVAWDETWVENDHREQGPVLFAHLAQSSTMKLSKNETSFTFTLFAVCVQFAYTAKEQATDFVAQLREELRTEPATVDDA